LSAAANTQTAQNHGHGGPRHQTTSHALKVLTLHRVNDARLGECYAVHGKTARDWGYGDLLRLVGFTHARKVSGKRESGGPGHRVPMLRLMPVGQMTAERLAATHLVLARANGARPQKMSELIKALRDAQRAQGQATIREHSLLAG